MKICFYGTYQKDYSRNQMIFNGLEDLHADYEEVHAPPVVERLHNPKHLTVFRVIKRILRKLKIIPVTIFDFKIILTSDILFVGYPGHLDLPLAYLIAKLTKKPLIYDPLISLYFTFTDDFKILAKNSIFARLVLLYERIIFNAPDLLITHTEEEKEFFHQLFHVPMKKIRVMYLGANDRIYNFSGDKDFTSNMKVVYYGLYNPLHGVEYMIEAARLCSHNQDIKFLMVGDGQTYEHNFKLAQKYQLKNVIFYKDLTEKDGIEVLKTADIFLGQLKNIPTAMRAIPHKVVQGAALGTVVVTQESDMLKRVFTHKKDIYFCQTENAQSLADALLTLQKDINLRKRISLNASRLFLAKFTPRVIGQQLLKISSELV